MTIRQAKKSDWPQIKRLVEMFPEQLAQDELPKWKSFFVAVEREKIVGCCALEVYSKKIAEIRSLAVTKRHRGKGIATELIKKCIQRADRRKIREILAITGALQLFKKLGFETFHQEKYALIRVL